MSPFSQICQKILMILAIIGLVNGVSLQQDLSMTLKEKQVLDKFREQVAPLLYKSHMKTDIYLIRWLRATNFNANNAEAMLKENIKWRKENKMDTIHLENFDDMFLDFPTTVDTYDKEGRPVGVLDVHSNWDIRQAVLAGKGPRLLRYMYMLLDNVTMQVFERQQMGMNVTQWTAIANGEGFNLIKHGCPACLPIWIRFIASLESNFQGWVHEFIVIEATPAVHTIFDIMRPFLSQRTRDAIQIFGSNKRQWMAYMDKRISREERRSAYGGTKPPVERE